MTSALSATLMAAGRGHALAGAWARAEGSFRAAWRADPGNKAARHALATALLALGRYPEGFSLYALRRELPQFPQAPGLPCPEWRGEPLEGKHIVLFPEQGLGDQIQFARFAPMLAERGAEVTLFCAPALQRLFGSLGVRVLAASGRVEFPDPDYWAFSIDVPGALKLNLQDLPGGPYLEASARRRTNVRIGVMRRGNPRHANDANRSMPPAVRLPFEAISLAPADTGARDLRDTAELIAGLDLVVSVDTAVAHLAGALGKRTFLMLPAVGCDWRWLSGRSDSPWYESMTLFRFEPSGGWDALVARVGAAIESSREQSGPARGG